MRGLANAWSVDQIILGTKPKFTFWYVGAAALKDTVLIPYLKDQLGPKKYYTKENSYIDRVYKPKDTYDRKLETSGWWCIDADIDFAVFKHKSSADLWLQLLHAGKPV